LSRRIVFTKRIQLLGLLSVPSGMPLGFVFNALQFFLVDLGVSRRSIGLLSGVSVPLTHKFLWAPLVDRYALPWPGRRRSWVIVTQLLLALAFGGLAALAWRALADRREGLPVGAAALGVGILALVVAFLAATQDIAYDAYSVEYVRPAEHAAVAGTKAIYYRLGMLLAGAVAVSLSDWLGWPLVFLLTGAVFLGFIALTLVSPEPDRPAPAPRSLGAAVTEPFRLFFRREDAVPLALFLVFYKLGDNMAGTMVNPFLKDLCFGNAEAGAAVKTVGTLATIGGTVLATGLTARLGLGRALWIFGLAQAGANLFYAAAALSRGVPLDVASCGGLPALAASTRAWTYVGIAAEYGAQGMASTAQAALLLRVCDRRHSATQFALLTSLFGLGRWAAGLPSGYLVESLGYPLFFAGCATAVALPGFLFLSRVAPLGQRDVSSPPAGDAT